MWGIDPSSVRVSLGILAGADPKLEVRSVALSQVTSRTQRFEIAFARQVAFFQKAIFDIGTPDVVYLEEPYVPKDRSGQPTHLYMYGVTLAALGQALGVVDTIEIPPQTWKSKALGAGRGRAEKPEIMRWAQSLGYAGRSQDEADAIGVCVAGAILRGLSLP